MTKRRYAILILLSAGLAPGFAGAADDAASSNHGYFGVGLLLSSNNAQSPLGDTTSTGGGIVLNGAGVLDTGAGVGIGITGAMDIGQRTYDEYDASVAEFQMGFDGGVILADLFYLSLGLQFLNQTPDDTDVTTTYTVLPLGLGVLKGTDDGYLLAQLRFGGGQASNDQNSATEDLGFFGIRLMGQTGTADGLQFMGGLEFDAYDASDIDSTDNFFRFFFGLGFGS